MNHEEWTEYIVARDPAVPLFLEGQPGIGKSALGYQAHARLSELHDPCYFANFDLASRLPEDFVGGMWLNHEKGMTTFLPMADLKPLLVKTVTKDGKTTEEHPHGLMMIDDATIADTATKKVMYAILGPDRTVGGHRISKNVHIILTGNRKEDKAGAVDLYAPVLNRIEVRDDIFVDPEVWCRWYMAQRPELPGLVPAFIRWRLSLLTQSPTKDADKRGRFATPRAWHNLARQYNAALKTDCLDQAAIGCVGEGPGMEFSAFARIRQELDPAAILDGAALPESLRGNAINEDPGKAVSLSSALSEVAHSRMAATKDEDKHAETALKLLNCLNTLLPSEYAAMGLRHFFSLNAAYLMPITKLAWGGKLEGTPAGELYNSVCKSYSRTRKTS